MIRMKVSPEKHGELVLVLTSLVPDIRKEKGCKRCDFCFCTEDKNELCLFGEWENRKSLDRHFRSELFKVLLGAMSLLENPYEMKLYSGLPTTQSPDMAGELSLYQKRNLMREIL